ncbi:MAG: ribonuclease E activity regulator RraA [Gammaproteobacteria bacterium]|nr:ribonuclease E activity regulator RraA [Gammaproteobacteria bacterium]
MKFKTADLYDRLGDKLAVASPCFHLFGRRNCFGGMIRTIKCHEDNALVRAALQTPGEQSVLVVDGGGSLRYALVGDQLAALAIQNQWAGLIINGCIRDRLEIEQMNFAVMALASNPRKSIKRSEGQTDIPVHFADVDFRPGDFVYADTDGIVVSADKIL